MGGGYCQKPCGFGVPFAILDNPRKSQNRSSCKNEKYKRRQNFLRQELLANPNLNSICHCNMPIKGKTHTSPCKPTQNFRFRTATGQVKTDRQTPSDCPHSANTSPNSSPAHPVPAVPAGERCKRLPIFWPKAFPPHPIFPASAWTAKNLCTSLQQYKGMGIRHIVALRGDIPSGMGLGNDGCAMPTNWWN